MTPEEPLTYMGAPIVWDCPKCHDIGVWIQHTTNSASGLITSTPKWCHCPAAQRQMVAFRSQAYPKGRIALLQRDFLERMAELHKPK